MPPSVLVSRSKLPALPRCLSMAAESETSKSSCCLSTRSWSNSRPSRNNLRLVAGVFSAGTSTWLALAEPDRRRGSLEVRYHVRRDGDHQLVILFLLRIGDHRLIQPGDITQPRDTAHRECI